MSAMEKDITKLSEDERAVFESIIAVLRSDLAAKEVSIDDLMAELSAVQQQLQEITATLPPEESCANEQYYIDGSCKNCPPGLEFSFSDSKCIPTASYCHAQRQVLEDNSCRDCAAGLEFGNNECIPTESPCANDQYYVDGSCKNCPLGLEFSFSDGECIPTESYCHAQEQVLEGNRCRDCAAGMAFSNDKCIVAESSCDNGQVDTDGNCKNCVEGMEWKNGECIPTESYCHAQGQVLEDNSCRDCATGTVFSNNQCITGVLCEEEYPFFDFGFRLDDERCIQADGCPLGTEFRDGECITTTSSCGVIGQVYVDGSCQYCSPGTVFRGGECITTTSSCGAIKQVYVDGSCQSCPVKTAFRGGECISITMARCIYVKGQIYAADGISKCAQNCPSGTEFSDDKCVPISPPPPSSVFDTAEYRANPMYEDIKPLYAYEKGYFGQGVTVALYDDYTSYAFEHPDLVARFVTTGFSDFRINGRGSQAAGILGANLNGVGMHGIAPEVKMLPFGLFSGYYTDGWLRSNTNLRKRCCKIRPRT